MGDTGCCGAHFRKDVATFLGLMTFSIPAIILCAIALPIFWVMGGLYPSIQKIKGQILVILRANLRLIYAVPLYPRARCDWAGKVFSCSSMLSGAVYRLFNAAILICAWAGIIFCFYLVASFVRE